MNPSRAWERSYPPCLRNDRLDLTALPPSLAALAGEWGERFGTNTASTLVLPHGLTARSRIGTTSAVT